MVAQDAREAPPQDDDSLLRLFDTTVLTNRNFLKKGPYVKMCAWYSILEAVEHYDPVWTRWNHLMQWLATNMMPKAAMAAREQVVRVIAEAVEVGAHTTAAEHKQQLMQIKRSAGNVLLMTPLLLTSENLFNMRLLLLVGRPLWTEQSLTAASETTGQQRRAMNLARGSGVDFCKTLFRHTTGDARELARLGLRTTRDSKPYPLSTPSGELDRCVPEAEISERIWSFVMHVIEARLQSTSWHQHGWPGSFALIMDPQLAMEGCRATAEAYGKFSQQQKAWPANGQEFITSSRRFIGSGGPSIRSRSGAWPTTDGSPRHKSGSTCSGCLADWATPSSLRTLTRRSAHKRMNKPTRQSIHNECSTP